MSMLISKAAREAYVNRAFASFTWMKRLTERQLLSELALYKTKPYFKTRPWLHQYVCFHIGMCQPRFLFLLDMGAGKSKILMDLISQRRRERTLRRALITVPRLINMGSWETDIERHSTLEPILCSAENIEEKWEMLMVEDGDLAIIDYQGLCLAVCDKNKKKGKLQVNDKKMKMLRSRYNFIGIDESHKLKSHDSLWHSVIDKITAQADYVYATTGTLFGKDPEDLWSQFYLVDRGETFGDNLGLFRATFYDKQFDPWSFGGQKLVYDKKTAPQLNTMIQNKSIRYNEREFSDVPKAVHIRVPLRFASEQREHYLRALEGVINAQGKLQEIDAGWFRMRQITSGYVAWKDDHGEHIVRFKENPKLLALERLLEESGDSKMVISTEYTETGRMITDMLTKAKIGHVWLHGGCKDPIGMLRKFTTDLACRVFVMNSEAGGTGVDGLQKVAKYMVLYETPSSPITRKQVMKRVHRPGQTERAYFYDLTITGSVDIGILDDVEQGIDLYRSVVDGNASSHKLMRLFKDDGKK